VAGPFMGLVRGFTVKSTARRVADPRVSAGPPRDGPEAGLAVARHPALFALWWGDKHPANLERSARTFWALGALGSVIAKAFFYVFWLPALLGLWWSRARFRQVPGAWVLALVGLLLGLVLYRVAHLMGYLGERHAVLIVFCGTYWAAAALVALGPRLAALLARALPDGARARWLRGVVPLALLLVLTGVPLARTLETLHADRAGFRTAGSWLARHTCPGDYVEDPYAWAHYYAGRVFVEGQSTLPTHTPPVSYVVLEHSRNPHPHLPPVRQALAAAARGKVVRRWPVRRGKDGAEVVVYEVPGVPHPGRQPADEGATGHFTASTICFMRGKQER
jgi:hypothetical protein